MRVRLHYPFLLAFLAVVLFTGIALALTASAGIERSLENRHEQELAGQIALAGTVLAMNPALTPDAAAALLAGALGYHVTLIDSVGAAVGDAWPDGARPVGRARSAAGPEVRAARAGEVAFTRREQPGTGVPMLYAAGPVRLGGQGLVLRLGMSLEAAETAIAAVRGAMAIWIVLASTSAVILALLLSRTYSRPLVALSERAGALASGDFSRRVIRNTRIAELDDLAVGFNRLADQLDTRLIDLGRERDEMQALIDTMAEGVVALTSDARVLRVNRAAREFLQLSTPSALAPVGTLVRQRELRELLEESVVRPVHAREVQVGERHFIASSRHLERGGSVTTFLDVSEVRRLEQVRRDFVANVSHELKTPLTSIRGFAETLIDDEPPEELRRHFLELVRRNTLRLQRLVDDLLDLARLESGRWYAKAAPVEVAAAVREAWQPFEARATEKGVAFEVTGEATAAADDQGLSQIFQNLFDNALRYTPPGGRITVAVSERVGAVTVAVSDTGSGIPRRSLQRVFERFYRVDPARSREAGGTGLGLAIVRHLVQGMGGEVSAESELGRGTTIRVTLRTAPAT